MVDAPAPARPQGALAEARVADIGRRANALAKAGFYSRDEVQWLSGYVRSGGCDLIEVELLLTNAEVLSRGGA